MDERNLSNMVKVQKKAYERRKKTPAPNYQKEESAIKRHRTNQHRTINGQWEKKIVNSHHSRKGMGIKARGKI